jgi:hypothetical protein
VKRKKETPRFAIVILALIAMLVAIVAVSAVQKSQRSGELAFEVETVDVGNVPLGQTVVQRYNMRNVGDKPVTITKKVAAALEGC